MKQPLIISTLAAALLLSGGPVLAADQEQIYGSQLMTQQERMEYRTKQLNAKSAAEREQIRQEHHAMMQERAKAQGKTLPDEPPAGGGMHKGGGMGPGGGMGTGGGMGGR
jgi:hypothetical protein